MSAGTLTLAPEFPLVRTSRRRAYTTAAESGFAQRRQVHEREIRTWALSLPHATIGDAVNVWDAWALAAGTVLDLDWTPPGESSARVHFTRQPSVTRLSAVQYAIDLELEEVL